MALYSGSGPAYVTVSVYDRLTARLATIYSDVGMTVVTKNPFPMVAGAYSFYGPADLYVALAVEREIYEEWGSREQGYIRPGRDADDYLAPQEPPRSGVYVPVLTHVANVAASTAYACQWARLGDLILVSGKVDVDPTLTVTSTQLGISLPVRSVFTAAEQCGGVAFAPGIATQGAGILADVGNARAVMQWVSGDVTNQPMTFTFMYQVIR